MLLVVILPSISLSLLAQFKILFDWSVSLSQYALLSPFFSGPLPIPASPHHWEVLELLFPLFLSQADASATIFVFGRVR